MKDDRKTRKQLIEELEELRTNAGSASSPLATAVQSVQTRAVSMRHSEDLLGLVGLLFHEIQDLGVEVAWTTIHFLNPDADEWADYTGVANPARFGITWTSPDLVACDEETAACTITTGSYTEWLDQEAGQQWQAGQTVVDGLALDEHFVRSMGETFGYDRVTDEYMTWSTVEVARINVPFDNGLFRLAVRARHPEDVAIAEAMTDALSLGYVRFLDLLSLELQTTQLRLDRAAERVRAAAMSMSSTAELHDVVCLIFTELLDLGVDLEACNVILVDEQAQTMTNYYVRQNPRQYGVDWTSDALVEYSDQLATSIDLALPLSRLEEQPQWRKNEVWSYPRASDDGYFAEFAKKIGAVGGDVTPEFRAQFEGPRVSVNVPFEHGFICFRARDHREEHVTAVQALTQGLSLGFLRYLDFQRLEQRNRELEVERALERVRGQVAAMQRSEDLYGLNSAIAGELESLGVRCRGIGINLLDVESRTVRRFTGWAARRGLPGDAVADSDTWDHWRSGQTWVRLCSREEIEEWHTEAVEKGLLSEEEAEACMSREPPGGRWVVDVPFASGTLATNRPCSEPFADEDINLLERFTEVFALGYTRFLDLQNAEARARQADIDIGVERVRSASMGMASSEDLPGVVATLFREMTRLGAADIGAGINFVDEERQRIGVWNVFPSLRRRGIRVGKSSCVELDDEAVLDHFEADFAHPGWSSVLDAWRRREPTSMEKVYTPDDNRGLATYFELEGSEEAIEAFVRDRAGTFQIVNVPFTYGTIGYHTREPTEDHVAVVQTLAGALELGYLRYFDLQAAEERAALATREAAYERIRGAVLAARGSDDILAAANLMAEELRGLGVRAGGTGINIVDEGAGVWWQFAGEAAAIPLDDPIVAEVVAHWRRSEYFMRPLVLPTSLVQAASHRAMAHAVVVDVPFTYGTLAMNSTEVDEFSQAEIDILQGFADVMSLAYTRYLDFQRLEEANRRIQEETRQKSDFLSRMSHDLRTPMNAIIGYTRILTRRLKGVIEGRQFRNLENIQTSADNLLHLINEILDLSRIEAGRIELKPAPVDLGQLVAECAASIEPLLKPGVELVQALEPLPTITSDADRLRRVLMNLLGNAVKFTESGAITVSLLQVDGQCQLAVADTGVGIPAEDLPDIFEEFRQVERQVGEKKEGTGLGLAIAARSVEMLGGAICAESEVGKGTTFTVRIGDYPPA